MKRAHETAEHIAMKSELFHRLVTAGFLVKAEEANADIVAFLPGYGGICAVECERSVRNAIGNMRRNLNAGAAHVVTVADSLSTKMQILKKVRRALPRRKQSQVTVLCMSDTDAIGIGQTVGNALQGHRERTGEK